MNIKRFLYICFFLVAFLTSILNQTVHAADNGNPLQRKIVRINVQSRQEINELANIVAPLEVHKDYIVADVTGREMQQVLDKGFTVEVMFESIKDLEASYDGAGPKAGAEGLYHSYSELKSELHQLELAYPQIAKVYDIGDSWEKTQGVADRDILAIKISDNVALNEDEPEILFVGAHHAREWISVEVPFYLARYLVENYNTNQLIRSYIDKGEIWIVPMVNPDGHQYSVDVDRWWRKNRKNNGNGSYGVDLNRNYGYMWGGTGSSGDPWSEIYRGVSAFSEPETQAIQNLGLTHNFRAMMTYHSYGQLVMYPWGYTNSPAPDAQMLSHMTTYMAGLIKPVYGKTYTPQQSSQLYLTSGTTDDWFYGALDTFGFTIELRPVGYPYFELPESEIVPTWEENKPAALYLIAWSQLAETPIPDINANGSDGPVTIKSTAPLSITVSLDPGVMSGSNADWWAVAETPFGWYHYDVGSDSWMPGLTVTYQGPLFNLALYQILNMSGLPVGPYTFYFGVDMTMNGSLDMGVAYYDSVAVNVTP